jgi:mannose-P-dolichol utilization defect protein 1
METLAYLITLIYAYRNQFPFSTYGENLFLTIQNVLITLLIIYYFPHPQSHLTTKRAPSNRPVVFLGALITFTLTWVLLVLPLPTLQLLQMGTVPISLFSKLPQISENYSNKSTGQLSVFAVVSQILGCAARLFTTLTEVDDLILLAGFALALVLNVLLGIQIWQYWGNDVRGGAKTKEKESKESWPAEKPAHASTHTQQHPAFAPVPPPAGAPLPPSNRRWARKVD